MADSKFDVVKQYGIMCESDWFKSRPPAIQKAYRDYPEYKFYTSKEFPKTCRRICGFGEREDGSIVAIACTAHFGWINQVIGGVPLEDLVAHDEWPADRKAFIETALQFCRHDSETALNAFLRPEGFALLVDESMRRKASKECGCAVCASSGR